MQASFRYKSVFRVAGILITSICSAVAQQSTPSSCESLHPDDAPAAMLAYLQQDRDTLQYSCIEMALVALGHAQYRPAINALIDYLDLKELAPVVRLGPTNGLYPAAEALARFGEPVASYLEKVISNNEGKKLARINAARTYLFVSRDKAPALSFIAKAARESRDPEAGDALRKIVEFGVKHCPAKDQERCKEALNAQ